MLLLHRCSFFIAISSAFAGVRQLFALKRSSSDPFHSFLLFSFVANSCLFTIKSELELDDLSEAAAEGGLDFEAPTILAEMISNNHQSDTRMDVAVDGLNVRAKSFRMVHVTPGNVRIAVVTEDPVASEEDSDQVRFQTVLDWTAPEGVGFKRFFRYYWFLES